MICAFVHVSPAPVEEVVPLTQEEARLLCEKLAEAIGSLGFYAEYRDDAYASERVVGLSAALAIVHAAQDRSYR